MPRTARMLSSSNIYHVMLRGNNRQTIFESDGDRRYFLSVVKFCKKISGFRLYAFCLMPNHVHLLIEPAGEPLDLVFRRIGVRYAGWYNRKYERVGHLFQDRFRSENVDSEQYFMTVLRYILQNPMKAGMEAAPGTYPWSSSRAYVQGAGSITDTQFALDLFGGRDNLLAFLRENNDDSVMEDEEADDRRLRDEEAMEIITQISGCGSVSEFRNLEKPQRRACVREAYLKGLSVNQIARLTGISNSTVSRWVEDLALKLPAEPEKEPVLLHEAETEFVPYDEIW